MINSAFCANPPFLAVVRAVSGPRAQGKALDDHGPSQEVFGSRNERLIKQYRGTVVKINALEPKIEQLSDDDLRGKTETFRQRIAGGESIDALLPEAFAVCREASKRVMKMRHFDVQLIGGMVLNDNKIAEMRTGEGKTLDRHAGRCTSMPLPARACTWSP